MLSLRWRVRPVRRPIFLWGPGRAGSYLLYDSLSAHPGVVSPRGRRRRSEGLYGNHHYGMADDYAQLRPTPFPPIEGAKRMILRDFPHPPEHGPWPPELLDRVEREYRRFGATTLTRRRILDKAPQYTFLVALLEQLFPDASHVCCLRDPAAVANSYVRRMLEDGALDSAGWWGWRPEGWEALADRPIADRAAWAAAKTVRRAVYEADRLGAGCTVSRYEEFVADPRRELASIVDALQLEPIPDFVRSLPPEFPNYNRAPDLLDDVSDEIRSEIEDLRQELGYNAQ